MLTGQALRSALLIVFGVATGGQVAAERLTVERVFAEPSLSGSMAHGVKMSPNGRQAAFLQPAADDATAIVIWIAALSDGRTRPVLDSRILGAAPAEVSEAETKLLERRHQLQGEPLEYAWSADGRSLFVNFAQNLYLVSVDTGRSRRLTRIAAPQFDAQLAPDARHASFVRGSMLYVLESQGGREYAVAGDASDTVSYGTSEFVAQEEMQRFTGAWWSPDSAHLAYTRTDESGVQQISRLRIDAGSTSVVADRFPIAGTANARVELFVRHVDSGQSVKVNLGANPDIYLYDVTWAVDGRTLYVQRQSRDQRRLDLLAVDPDSGRSQVLLTEMSETWVDLTRDFKPLRDGTFLWGSARSGWQHLYLYGADGHLIRPVTRGSWRVAYYGPAAPDLAAIVGVDETRGLVYFVASKETPLEQQLYVVSYRHAGTPRQLTKGPGWWIPQMAGAHPAGVVASYSDPNTPPQTAIYDLQGRRVAWLAENALDENHALHEYVDQRPRYSFGTLPAADGTPLEYVLAVPADFNPAKRYPVIVRVYGGPNVQMVKREWRSPVEQLLTQEGYIIFQLDNRGSANRSIAFEHATYHDLIGKAVADQLAGIRFLQGQPFVDSTRIGVQGWSFGGYMTVLLLTTSNSGVRAGAAGGVPSDFHLYDTHYTERFLGTPQENGPLYDATALAPRAMNLEGRLLLAYGLSDDNVQLANFTSLLAALQGQGKVFDIAVYPGQGHAIRGSAPAAQLWKTYLDFFGRALAAPERAH